MPRTIRKHPIAFVHVLGWFCAGLSMLYIMHYEDEGYYAAQLAEAAVLLAALGCVLIVLTPVIGLAVKLLRKQSPAAVREKRFLQAAAKWYESTQPDFWKYYAAAIAAVVLPFLALLSVVLVEDYVAGVLFISIGLSIWLICVCIEMPQARLLKISDTADRFQIRSGASPDEIDRLHKACTLGMAKARWDGRRDTLFNMLYKEGLVDERSRIAAYDCPASGMAAHFGADPERSDDEEVIWIPLNQFSMGSSKGRPAIQKLFTHSLSRIADLRFTSNRSTDPMDYPFSSGDVRLQPDETARLQPVGDDLSLICASAVSDEAAEELYCQGCMLQLIGPQLAGVKWDHFEDITPPAGGEEEYFLPPDDAQKLWRLLLNGVFPYEITAFHYMDDQNLLAVEIWADPASGSAPADSRGVPFVGEDGAGYLLLIAFHSLRWHWMQATDLTQPQCF